MGGARQSGVRVRGWEERDGKLVPGCKIRGEQSTLQGCPSRGSPSAVLPSRFKRTETRGNSTSPSVLKAQNIAPADSHLKPVSKVGSPTDDHFKSITVAKGECSLLLNSIY